MVLGEPVVPGGGEQRARPSGLTGGGPAGAFAVPPLPPAALPMGAASSGAAPQLTHTSAKHEPNSGSQRWLRGVVTRRPPRLT